jgi:amino acid permease
MIAIHGFCFRCMPIFFIFLSVFKSKKLRFMHKDFEMLFILLCLLVIAFLGYVTSRRDTAHPAAESLLDDDLREQGKMASEAETETGRKKVFKAIVRAFYKMTGK